MIEHSARENVLKNHAFHCSYVNMYASILSFQHCLLIEASPINKKNANITALVKTVNKSPINVPVGLNSGSLGRSIL